LSSKNYKRQSKADPLISKHSIKVWDHTEGWFILEVEQVAFKASEEAGLKGS